jgi:DNA-binding beta-propeller fold protein YncE
MKSPVGRVLIVGLLALGALVLAGAGCGLGQTGIDPPMDQIFWPAGLAVDPNGNWLYVVNSNNDLRFNAGTLIAIDLQKAKSDSDRQKLAAATDATSAWSDCTTTHFSDDTARETLAATLDQPCCVDLLRPNILNCNERAYVQADATVQIGSFGGEAVIQTYKRDPNDPNSELVRRMFMMVRAEPSITFVDITPNSGSVHMRCNGPRKDGDPQLLHPFCDDNWRIRRPSGAAVTDNVLPEEPHSLALDENLGILYVSHLTITVNRQVVGGGISTIDIGTQLDPNAPNGSLLDPDAPNVINSIARVVFPASLDQGVTALTLNKPGDPNDPNDPNYLLFGVARASSDITGMVLQCQKKGQHCDPNDSTARDLSLVPGEQITSSAFLPSGTDVRGFLLSPDGTQAYVLHRNTPELSTSTDPAALVVLDRRTDQSGQPANRPSAILEICGGPTRMQFHNAGRGDLLYITCFEAGQIYVVDPQAPPLVKAIIEAGHGPTALTFSPTDPTVAFVADYADNEVAVIDLEPGSLTEYMVVQRLGFPHAVTQ